MEKKSYAGAIKNTGSQKVEALYKTPKGKSPDVKKGKDLRGGKK
ncbi:MAG: hypothetical protein RRY54_04355 [Angelakisella sp.]